jgi:hypothetical protein
MPLPSGEESLNCFNDYRTEDGSSQGQNLASTGVFLPTAAVVLSHTMYQLNGFSNVN